MLVVQGQLAQCMHTLAVNNSFESGRTPSIPMRSTEERSLSATLNYRNTMMYARPAGECSANGAAPEPQASYICIMDTTFMHNG